MNDVIELMIVDDHQMFIDGLKALLRHSREIKVIGESKSGEEALEMLQQTKPNVMITDISMPGMKGDELAKIVSEKYPEVKILALSMHNDIQHIDMMINAGVKGYILKNTGKAELIDAIKTVSQGKNFFSVEVKEAMLSKYIKSSTPDENKVQPDKEVYLTRREKQIIKLIMEGFSNIEIAEKLSLSVYTVSSHRRNIYSKTHVNNAASLIDYVRKNNIYL